jgi:hypothetical protein
MTTGPSTPDVTEMTAVHRVFRNSFAAAPGLIDGVKDGDTARAAVVGSFLTNVLGFLHVHHGGEDDLLFPKLLDRATDKELVARIAGQHHDVDRAFGATESSLAAWTSAPDAASGAALRDSVAELQDVLLAHLDEEESTILPIVAEHITAEEWGELPGHAMGAFEGDVWLILGLVREQMNEEQRDRMFREMPPPVVEAWKTVGLPAYRQTVADLVGSPS